MAKGETEIDNIAFQTANINLTEHTVSETTLEVYLLPVTNIIISTTSIRTTYDLIMEIVVETGVLIDNAIIYLEFSNIYFEAMFFSWGPICEVLDQFGNDFADGCENIGRLRVAINMKADTNNTATKQYNVSVKGIPTTNYETEISVIPMIWIGNIQSNLFIL